MVLKNVHTWTLPIWYGSIGLLVALIDGPLVVLVPKYLNEHVGMSLAAIGILFGCIRLFDTGSDVVIGYVSDKYLGSARRLHRMVWWSLPVCAGVAYGAYTLESGTTWYVVGLWLFALLLIRSLLDIPHIAIGAFLQTNSADPTTTVFYGARSIFAVVGVLMVAYVVQINAGITHESLAMLAPGIVGVVVVLMVVQAFFRKQLPDQRDDSASVTIVTDRFERHILGAYLVNQISNALAASLVLLYIEHQLGMASWSGYFLGALFLTSACSVWLWHHLSGRYDQKVLWRVSLAIACFVFLWVPFIAPGAWAPYLAVCIIAGATFGADAVLPASILAHYRAKQGDATNFSTLFGIKSMAAKMAVVIPIVIAFPVLSMVGFRPEDGEVSTTGIRHLVTWYAIIPALLKLLAIGVLGRAGGAVLRSRSFDNSVDKTGDK